MSIKKSKPSDNWDTLIIGGKGSGKSYASLVSAYLSSKQMLDDDNTTPEEKSEIKKSLYKLVSDEFKQYSGNLSERYSNGTSEELTSPYRTTSDNTGEWVPTTPRNPWSNDPQGQVPWSDPPYGQQSGWQYNQWGTKLPEEKEKKEVVKEKPKHSPEELKGKLVAFATIRVDGIEHRGILFVRKCGAWKLIEFTTMNKVASGGKDSPMPDVTVHYIIYSEQDENNQKKSRFEEIDME
jgi:hypothetical protein